jgi:formyl-CoA transferase
MHALKGVKVLDFTHVQSGPTCTQLLAWLGADVIKVERPGVGDATRGQLRDVPNADSLYFTMLNHNKRSIELNSKNETGKEVLERLVKQCDVLVENFAPGALDRMGLTWERIQELNPRMIYASVKGFGPGPYEECKVYENVAQCAGGSASTTGFSTARRPSPAPRSVTPAPACTWPSAFWQHFISAPIPARASACWLPCRTAC